MKQWAIVLFISALLSCAKNPASPGTKTGAVLSDVEKQVYLAATGLNNTQTAPNYLVISASPEYDTMGMKPDSVVTTQVIDAYKSRNDTFHSWAGTDFDLGYTYTMIGKDSLNAIFANGLDGWDKFNNLFPDAHGFWSFSKIGFNADTTVALLSYGHIYGSLGADWELLGMRKVNGIWKTYTVYMWTVS